MSDKELTTIEINGVKLEVDLRTAKTIEHYKLGDNVKILVKSYNDKYDVFPGVIIDFVNFKEAPCIVVCYLKNDYSACELKFATINEKSGDSYQLQPMGDYEVDISKDQVLEKLDSEIYKTEETVRDLKTKKAFFIAKFEKFFTKEVIE